MRSVLDGRIGERFACGTPHGVVSQEGSDLLRDPGCRGSLIAISPDHQRVVITGYGAMKNRVVIARFDTATGHLAIDERFREAGATPPGYLMSGKTWPHGSNAIGIPHGAVFSRR